MTRTRYRIFEDEYPYFMTGTIVGKWHLKDPPKGFDHSRVLPGQGAYFDPVMIADGERKQFSGYVSEVITDETLRWLGQRDSGKPFCLLVHHKAPHAKTFLESLP